MPEDGEPGILWISWERLLSSSTRYLVAYKRGWSIILMQRRGEQWRRATSARIRERVSRADTRPTKKLARGYDPQSSKFLFKYSLIKILSARTASIKSFNCPAGNF